MTSESEGFWDSGIPEHVRKRVLFLARNFGLIEISRMRGMPDLRTLYSAIGYDPAFKEKFLKANNHHRQCRRAGVADLLKRVQGSDLSRVFVELRKLKNQSVQGPEQNPSQYDLRLLSDDEFADLERILSKAASITAPAEFPQVGSEEHP